MTAALQQQVERSSKPARRRWRRFRSNRLAVVSAIFLVGLVFTAAFADLLFVTDPTATDARNRFAAPFSSDHLLGTDDLGRDLFARVVFAARVSLLAGVGSVALALLLAIPVGLVAGYLGGRVETTVSWFVDLLLSIPPLILMFAVAGILGPSLRNAILALAVYFTPLFVRLVIAETRRMRHTPLVEAARSVGSSSPFIMARHVLPNVASPLIVQASLSIGVAIIAEASLSYLGLGVRPPTPSWGGMLRGAFDTIQRDAWGVFVPATAMAITVLAFNFLGDGLRQALERLER